MRYYKLKSLWLAAVVWGCSAYPLAAQTASYVSFTNTAGSATVVSGSTAISLVVDANDFPGVLRAARNLQEDIRTVSGGKTPVVTALPRSREIIVVGTIGKNRWIDQWVKSGKLDITAVRDKWESCVVQVIEKPMKGIDRAVVIAGSDKRGTIFGIYDMSRAIGVSPWHYWADVPAAQHSDIYIRAGRYVQGEPSVRYRGIFINDEEPALGRWAVEKFGGFNHVFYEHVFDLVLRLKGNYLWPAMWWGSFNSDDPLSPVLADEYGIVMGTTHHEPMMRAHAEWKKTGKGPWNYEKNDSTLKSFWTAGIRRMDNRESIVSIGMRGDGDMAMSEDTNIALLEKIVHDQRTILQQVTNRAPETTPQLWALYKEVQDYYDKGMRVPDDVTLLLCDDNWGNIRKLPQRNEPPRRGGYGIYYHFDYVGDPRNYKWMNTNQIERTWEQMHLADAYGANRIWIVNVGDIKPLEFPTSFFLDYAWDTRRWHAGNLAQYTQQWAAEQFGQQHATVIAQILDTYTKFNARRKPELLSPDTYSLANFREAERIVEEYNALSRRADSVYSMLPEACKPAYYQLVLHPVKASAVLNELHSATARNHRSAWQQRSSANALALRVRTLFSEDSALSHYYNRILLHGKWNHIMDQTHISYTYWQQPEKDVLPELKTVKIPATASMGVCVEGSEDSQSAGNQSYSALPEFDNFNRQQYFIDIFNKGQSGFTYRAEATSPCVRIDKPTGTVDQETRISVKIDWTKVTIGTHEFCITITGPEGASVPVKIFVRNTDPSGVRGFTESNGYVSIEAAHFTKAIQTDSCQWKIIPNLGRTGSAVASFPVTAAASVPGGASPHLQYDVHLVRAGNIRVQAILSPTLNFHRTAGLRFGISVDDGPVHVINMHENESPQQWSKWVSDNVNVQQVDLTIAQPGNHTVKFWRVDAGVVLQKLIIETAAAKPSYLGPPESHFETAH